ncbi:MULTISPECIES: AraC family transcriptional regulator [Pseudomonas]|jgi:AraC family transcriptional regulator|uniref:helix-turn-helix domain-containing protein n=1 Tax=Pseudomonas TaxID=286 RepID=UPI001C0A8192|nr:MULTISPECIES: AraC family transcriptional regulator [Pseudomonas]MCK3838870.1 AraC family transcriptional regulator [Pseudomonas sp. NCIMB 10586]VCU67859.1 Probable transcriptional regulator LumQ [Pseudomonas synxantha]
MKKIYQLDEGVIDVSGLQFESDVAMRIESHVLGYARVETFALEGDHRVQIQRDIHSLVFFSQGENERGYARVNGRKIPHGGQLRKRIDVLPSGLEYSGAYVGKGLKASILSIDPRLSRCMPSLEGGLDLKLRTQLNDAFMWTIYEQFMHASDPLLKESLSMTLLIYISRKSLDTPVSTGFGAGRKRRLVDYVEEHLEQPISISELADEVGVSVFHFLRLFKLAFFITPYQYILQRRVERAKVLLSHTTYSIEMVGFKCGFNSGSQFSQTFSRAVGQSPSAFRKSLS